MSDKGAPSDLPFRQKQAKPYEFRTWAPASISPAAFRAATRGPARPRAQGNRQGKKESNTVGNIFYGSKGYLVIDGYTGYKVYLGQEQEPGPARREGGSNWANFIKAVRSRKVEDLNAPIEEGYLSTVLVHLANISYRLGRTINFDPANERILHDEEASRMVTRNYRKPFVVPEKV